MRILVLIAGTNDQSNSATIAAAFMRGVKKSADAEVKSVRLKDLSIAHFTLDFYDPNCRQEEDFCTLQNKIEEAHGIVIATPIWNFGVPAHLKNLIDRMGSFALDATRSKGTLKGKPFYLIFTGGSPRAAWTGLMRKTTSFLPVSLKYFGGTIAGILYEGRCMKGRGVFGLVVDKRPGCLERAERAGARFADIVREYAATGKLPFTQTFLYRLYRIGQAIVKKL